MSDEIALTLGRFDTLSVMTIPGETTGYLKVNGYTVAAFDTKRKLTVKIIRQFRQINYIYPTSI